VTNAIHDYFQSQTAHESLAAAVAAG